MGSSASVSGLRRVERRVSWRVSYAASLGDRSDAEYIYGKKRLRQIDSRAGYLVKCLGEIVVDYLGVRGPRLVRCDGRGRDRRGRGAHVPHLRPARGRCGRGIIGHKSRSRVHWSASKRTTSPSVAGGMRSRGGLGDLRGPGALPVPDWKQPSTRRELDPVVGRVRAWRGGSELGESDQSFNYGPWHRRHRRRAHG